MGFVREWQRRRRLEARLRRELELDPDAVDWTAQRREILAALPERRASPPERASPGRWAVAFAAAAAGVALVIGTWGWWSATGPTPERPFAELDDPALHALAELVSPLAPALDPSLHIDGFTETELRQLDAWMADSPG